MTDPDSFRTLAASLGVEVPPEGARQLLAYLDAMLEENRSVNLTAVRERGAAVVFHALDSIVLGTCRLPAPPTRALDLGTGNGFPGVAIACLFPSAHVLLMDRTQKKLAAIERALERAGLDRERFETLQLDASEAPAHGYKRAFDLITTRAVGPPADLCRLARPLLTLKGRLVQWLSEETVAPERVKGGLRRLDELEYRLPPPADRTRRLATYGL